MKSIVALAIVGLCWSTSASALSAKDRQFISAMMAAGMVFENCPGYQAIQGSVGAWGLQNGVDATRIQSAVKAATARLVGKDYAQSDLIPEVTELVIDRTFGLTQDLDTKGKRAFCRHWGALLVEAGIVIENQSAHAH